MPRPEFRFTPHSAFDASASIRDCLAAQTWEPRTINLLSLNGLLVVRREDNGRLSLPTEGIIRPVSSPEEILNKVQKYSGRIEEIQYTGLSCYDMFEGESSAREFEIGTLFFLVDGTLNALPADHPNGYFTHEVISDSDAVAVLEENFAEFDGRRTALALSAIEAYSAVA